MHPKTLLLASLAAAAAFGTTIVSMSISDGTDAAIYEEHERQYVGAPHPVMPVPPFAAGQAGAQQPLFPGNGKRQEAPTAKQAVLTSLPQPTATGDNLDQSAWLKYLPKPGPMPTTIPHYPNNMAAYMTSAVSANMAKSKALSASSLTRHPKESAVIDSLVSEIRSLERATTSAGSVLASVSKAYGTGFLGPASLSAGAVLASLSHASSLESGRLASATKALAEKEKELSRVKAITSAKGVTSSAGTVLASLSSASSIASQRRASASTVISKNEDELSKLHRKKGSAFMLTPSLSLANSLAAFIGFALVAFFL